VSTASVSSAGNTSPVFQVSGLESGIDSSSIISSLVSIAQEPLTALQQQESDLDTRISTIGSLVSDLNALQTAAQNLGQNGALGVDVQSTNTAFTATAGSGAVAGTYQIQVQQLAQAAQALSQSFSTTNDLVTGGTLTLTAQGNSYDVAINDGESLADVATAINQSGAPVQATVLNTGTSDYLSITATNSGYPLTGSPSDALGFSETTTGTQGQPLALTTTQAAQNSEIQMGGPNGLVFTRQSNVVNDVVPGTTLTLQSQETSPETLVLANNTSTTQTNLQTFVSAYNQVVTDLKTDTAPPATTGTDAAATLANDPSVSWLLSQMQQVISSVVPGAGGVDSLAALGVTTNTDGTLSVDKTVLSNAIATDPGAVNALFSTSGTGVSDLVTNLVDNYTDGVTGILTTDQASLKTQVQNIQSQETDLQSQITTYQQTLQTEFDNMETTVSSLKNASAYITALFSSSSSIGDSSSSSSSSSG
jgi:flagellar hook-associated protein 2